MLNRRGKRAVYAAIVAIFLFLFVIFGSEIFAPAPALSYDQNIAHPNIVGLAAEVYNAKFDPDLTAEQIGWLRQGAIAEDTPTRWFNHFYDPINNQGLLFNNVRYQSSKKWAQDPFNQQNFSLGDNSWQKAFLYYYQGNEKDAFLTLGHTLHVIGDASVPAHTREDIHPTGDSYEQFVKNNWDKLAPDIKKSAKFQKVNSLDEALDTVAKFSNGNFYSDDTVNIDKYQKPIVTSFLDKYLEIGKGYYKFKVNKNLSDILICRDPRVNTWQDTIKSKFNDFVCIVDDDTVLTSYAHHLIPTAVGYTAGVIRLFIEQAESQAIHDKVPLIYINSRGMWDTIVAKMVDKAEDIWNKIKGNTAAPVAAETPSTLSSPMVTNPVITSQTKQSRAELISPNPPPTINIPKSTKTTASPPIRPLVLSPAPAPILAQPVSAPLPSAPRVQSMPLAVAPPGPALTGGNDYSSQSSAPESSTAALSENNETTTTIADVITPEDTTTTFETTNTIAFIPSETEGYLDDNSATTSDNAAISTTDISTSTLETSTTTIETTTTTADISAITPNAVSSTIETTTTTILEISTTTPETTTSTAITATTTTVIPSEIEGSLNDDSTTTSNNIATSTPETSTTTPTAVEISTTTPTSTPSEASPPPEPVAAIVINEIAWAGTDAGHASNEWLELYNTTDAPITLSWSGANSWHLRVNGADLSPQKINNSIIPAGGYYLFERTSDNTVKNVTADYIFILNGGISNSGAKVELITPSGTVVDSVDASAGWFAGGGSEYRSMERKDIYSDSNDSSTWQNNQGPRLIPRGANGDLIYGSPKAANFGGIALIGNQLEDNLILTASNSPYIVSGPVVPAGKKMTIGPGAVLKSNDFTSDITVYGTLIVAATADNPAIFTSGRDQSFRTSKMNEFIGNYPVGSVSAAKDWRGLLFKSGSVGEINNAVIRYAGKNFYPNGYIYTLSVSEAVRAENATVTIDNSSLSDDGAVFVRALSNSTLTVRNSIFANGDIALKIDAGSTGNFSNNQFNNIAPGI